MLEWWIFCNSMQRPRRRENFGPYFSPVRRCAKQRTDGVRGLPAVVWVSGCLHPSPGQRQGPVLAYVCCLCCPEAPTSESCRVACAMCPGWDIPPLCAAGELKSFCVGTLPHENRPPTKPCDSSGSECLALISPSSLGPCSASTRLRQSISLLTFMCLTLWSTR